jgi:hypothetical protein
MFALNVQLYARNRLNQYALKTDDALRLSYLVIIHIVVISPILYYVVVYYTNECFLDEILILY